MRKLCLSCHPHLLRVMLANMMAGIGLGVVGELVGVWAIARASELLAFFHGLKC